MKRAWQVPVYLGLVFLSGTAVGALGHQFYAAQSVRAGGPKLKPEEYRRQYIEKMTTRLHLAPDQAQRIDDVMEATGQKFHAHREQVGAEARAIREAHATQVRAILTDAQRPEYEKMRAEWERDRQRPGRR